MKYEENVWHGWNGGECPVDKHDTLKVDASILRDLLDCDFLTGELRWKKRPETMFKNATDAAKWNNKMQGVRAFTTVSDNGYYRGGLFGKKYTAHAVIWALYHGSWPKYEIDHINGDGLDNSIKNLRECNRSQNQMNRNFQKNSKTKIKGVWFSKSKGKYESSIRHYGKKVHIGTFDTIEEAAMAYEKAARELHGDYVRGVTP